MNSQVKKISIIAVTITLALVLSYVDSLINLFPGIPGIKLGLANIAIIFALYKLGLKEAITVSFLRIILSCILFSGILTFMYSFVGAILSLSLMFLLKKFKFHMTAVSITGAVMHNVGQILVAAVLMEVVQIIYYLPMLILTGVLSGLGIGLMAILVLKYTKDIKY